uniref:AB hydrolase-1 domain-containing protein n=1 Tax=Populus trichocarpa TaxID=3694 RepID=A0A2K1X3K9_POPTR
MARCLSFTAYRDWFYRYSFANAGLRSLSSNLGDGTIIHCWAQCVMRLMEAHGVHRMNLVGISYGRFVGYSMAAQFQEKIERVGVPSFFLTDLINVMCTDYVKEKRELIQAILQDRNLSDLPKITQPTLTTW